MKRHQAGLAAVEFALVGATAMTILFACLEVGRALFVWNAVGEATRRGARVAIVTDNADAARNAVLTYSDHLDGLTAANVAVEYYTETGAAAAGPGDAAFVTVRIQDFTQSLFIPGLTLSLAVPAFATTLPMESAGFDPD